MRGLGVRLETEVFIPLYHEIHPNTHTHFDQTFTISQDIYGPHQLILLEDYWQGPNSFDNQKVVTDTNLCKRVILYVSTPYEQR